MEISSLKVFWRKKSINYRHTGFKGSWLSLWLKYLGADVSGYSLDEHISPYLYELLTTGEEIKEFRGDVKNYTNLKNLY